MELLCFWIIKDDKQDLDNRDVKASRYYRIDYTTFIMKEILTQSGEIKYFQDVMVAGPCN